MATAKKSGSGRRSEFGLPYAAGDRIPSADAVEKDTESAWALWSNAAEAHEAKFADTEPASAGLLGASDPQYAKTEPAPLQGSGAQPSERAAVATPVTVELVMVEARRNNRVCPKPERWLE